MAGKSEFIYHKIELYKSESLGSGSYGGVCKAKCDGLLCAAKIMHPTLFDVHDLGAISYLRKFREECHLLSLARHPNIVQYLATYNDPETRLPVLLMELCDESLTAFLERSLRPLFYHVQVNICHDIALGLVYLHSNDLIHRDLTGNNVLMIAGTRAKITDFGMSKLATVNPRMTTLTLCPGNALYMSPEALDESKIYTAKLDVFSFGVLVIQICTRQSPNPTDRLRSICCRQQNDKDIEEEKEIREIVPETERREAHLSLIADTHPLKSMTLHCLKKEKQRPSAVELSEKLSHLKQSSYYTESMKLNQQLEDGHSVMTEVQTREYQEQHSTLTELQMSIQAKTRHLHANQEVIATNERKLLQYQYSVEEKEKELQQTREQLRASEQLVSKFQQSLHDSHIKITNLEETISTERRRSQQLEYQDSASGGQRQVTTPQMPIATTWGDISKMTWRKGKNAPQKMFRGAAVVFGNTAYIRPADSNRLYSYEVSHGIEQWSQLPEHRYWSYGLAVIDGLVTSVGGGYTSILLSLTGEGKKKHWSDIYPPMSTRRNLPACITTEKNLIVAGGSQESHDLDTVEVMNIKTKQWSNVSSLPCKCSSLSGIVCGGKIVLAGGIVDSLASNYVFTCLLSDLLPRTSSTLRAKIRWRANSRGDRQVWKDVGHLPVTHSTLASFNGHLLAIGGSIDSDIPTANVYRYDSHTNTWHIVSQMMKERSSCFAVTFHPDSLIVVGGYHTQSTSPTASVEILE